MAQLVRRWDRTDRGGSLSFAQYAALADSLAKLMDEVGDARRRSFRPEGSGAPLDLAEHWEGVTQFLDVIRWTQWPAVSLKQRIALNPSNT